MLVERYRKVVFDRPGDQVAIERLMDLIRQRDGPLTALSAELDATALSGGERAFAAQLLLCLPALRAWWQLPSPAHVEQPQNMS